MLLGAASLHAQIRQSDNLRAEQFVTEQRLQQQERQEEQQHQAQVEEMRRVDREQAREQHELDRQRELQAEAAQQALIQQQAEHQKSQQQQLEDQIAQAAPVAPQPVVPRSAPAANPQWSWKNFTLRDEIGFAALGLLLAALTFNFVTAYRRPRL